MEDSPDEPGPARIWGVDERRELGGTDPEPELVADFDFIASVKVAFDGMFPGIEAAPVAALASRLVPKLPALVLSTDPPPPVPPARTVDAATTVTLVLSWLAPIGLLLLDAVLVPVVVEVTGVWDRGIFLLGALVTVLSSRGFRLRFPVVGLLLLLLLLLLLRFPPFDGPVPPPLPLVALPPLPD